MLLQRLEVSETDGLTALSKVGQLPAQFVLLQLHTLLPSHHISFPSTSHSRAILSHVHICSLLFYICGYKITVEKLALLLLLLLILYHYRNNLILG